MGSCLGEWRFIEVGAPGAHEISGAMAPITRRAMPKQRSQTAMVGSKSGRALPKGYFDGK